MHYMRDAHEWLEREGRKAEVTAVGNVLDYRLKATPAAYRLPLDLENIEELFSLASAGKDDRTDDIRRAIAATIDYSESRVAEPMSQFFIESPSKLVPLPSAVFDRKLLAEGDDRQITAEAPTYHLAIAGLLGLLNTPRPRAENTFISFNYDLVAERALSALGVPFHYGFEHRTYTYHPLARRRLRVTGDQGVALLKLHGSINWAYPRRVRGKLTVYGSYEDVRADSFVPHLVPPTWRKIFDGTFAHVWEKAREKISQATRLVVIGFSMPPTDLHFKYLLASGLQDSLSLREVVFVDKNPDEVEKRARALFGDLNRQPAVRIVRSDAAQFALSEETEKNIGAIGRPRDSQLRNFFSMKPKLASA
jgi:hypothetical protein